MQTEAPDFAGMHRTYLRQAHPAAYGAMLEDGTLADHCDQRGIEAMEMADRVRADLHRQVMAGEREPQDVEHVSAIVAELVLDFVRAL